MSGAQASFDAVIAQERDLLLDPEINRDDSSMVRAQNGLVELTLLDGGRVFKRRAIKRVGTPNAEEICWLVAELDGVRIYVSGDRVVMTKQDLYP